MKQPSPSRKPKLRLAELQRITAKAIMRKLTPKAAMQPRWIDGRSMEEFAGGIIRPNHKCSSFERLEIYNRQYWFRLLDSLIEDFRGVYAILGQKRFDKLSEAYLIKHPSRSFTIRNLGDRFPAFIAKNPKYCGAKSKLALDMARLEWARVVAYDGPAMRPASISEIARAGASKLSLRLQPHVSLLALDYPVDEFAIALNKVEVFRTEATAVKRTKNSTVKSVPNPRRKKTFVAVHRVDNSVYFKNLGPAQYFLLSALSSGKSIEQACAFALRKLGPRQRKTLTPQALHTWFADWASFSWFCVFKSCRRQR